MQAAVLSAALFASQAPSFEARLNLGQLYTVDDLSDQHRAFTQLSTSLRAESPFGLEPLSLVVDGDGRIGWNKGDERTMQLSELYLRCALGESWSIAAGRQTIAAVSGARVDGGTLRFELAENAFIGAFGGLAPNPLTGAFDQRFSTAGLGYEMQAESINNAGGVALQLYRGEVDRLYGTERWFLRFGREWSAFAQATIDFARGIDLTNAQTSVRWRPTSLIDFTLGGSHVHAILPNKWWADWIAQERERLGFTIERQDPVGTRRSSARFTTNVHLSENLTPYLVGQYDHRHEDAAHGYYLQGGLKYTSPAFGYADLSGTHRLYFGSVNDLASIQVGVDIVEGFSIDAGISALRNTAMSPNGGAGAPSMLYDLNAGTWLDLRALSESMEGFRLLSLYTAFVEPGSIYHIFFFQLGFRT